MDDEAARRAARAVRREVIGDDGTAAADTLPAGYQDFVTTTAWGVWARGGPLSRRDRSLLVLAMTAATGRMGAFRIHLEAAPRAGVTDAEIDELLFQLTAYCGAPAGSEASGILRQVRAAREAG
ncbi:carboxymuconolactone decarboxylase family protein [Streptomyces fuscichromogenes]|uniref:carboxymuconolactone decarboxylase family protein n=1 Tax=Streptomyces fuscichromogenes TaxID=1324013 RepID=UPI00381ED6FC